MRRLAGLVTMMVSLGLAGVAPAAEGVVPKVADALQPIVLKQPGLAGELGRRINDLVYTNFMALDADGFFVAPFRSRPFTNGYHYVGVGKVVDAGGLFAAYTGDPKVAERTRHFIEGVLATRDADGYIGTFKPERDDRQNHWNWVLHEQEYLLLGLTHDAALTGDAKTLQAARSLADYVIRTFSKDPHPEEICTAGLPEAFLALYGATGDRRYLDFAANAKHGNGKAEIKCASLRDWRQTFETKPAHVYVMLARCYAQTELYRLDGAPGLMEMSRYMRGELLRTGGGLNVVGSASDGEHFSYTQNGAGMIGESCVTAYLLRWLDSLMRLEGDLRYGDLMERTIYNALFAAQDPAGRRLRYFTPFTGPRAYYNQDGFCCPGNYRRIVAELPSKVYYRCADGALAVNLFTPSRVTVPLADGAAATLTQETDYPSDGRVVFRVALAKAAVFALRLRIPRWCKTATVSVNGEPPATVSPGPEAFELRRTWSSGDTVTLDMPMVWRFVKGHRLQEGKAALMRGPLVFCLGAAQNADALKKYPGFGGVVVDPACVGEPEADASVRPNGRKVKVGVWVEAPGAWSKGAPRETLTFTEFVDPTGLATYVHLLDLGQAVEDELVSDCFAGK